MRISPKMRRDYFFFLSVLPSNKTTRACRARQDQQARIRREKSKEHIYYEYTKRENNEPHERFEDNRYDKRQKYIQKTNEGVHSGIVTLLSMIALLFFAVGHRTIRKRVCQMKNAPTSRSVFQCVHVLVRRHSHEHVSTIAQER